MRASRCVRTVALVSEHASPLAALGGADAGGQNVYVAALATALGARGFHVVVYTRRDDSSLPARAELAERVHVELVDAGPPEHIPKDALLPYIPAFAVRLRRIWRDAPPTLVHAHFWMSGLTALAAARPNRVPVVQTFHALASVSRRHGQRGAAIVRRDAAECKVATAVDAVIATTAEELDELAAAGATPRRAAVVPCGVDTQLFSPNGPTEAAARPRVVSVGRLVERKGADDVIRALASLPDAELVVAGGSGADDDDLDRLRAVARACGVEPRVDFRGPVRHDTVPLLLRSAAAACCVPWYEPFGMVALEAMACGVPVVASPVGGLRESVVDGVTGLYTRPRDPQAVAATLRRVLGDDELRRRLGRAAAERAASAYGWDHVVDGVVDVYERVVDEVAA